MPRGNFVKSFLTTSVTIANGATTAGSSAMNVPLMSAGIMPRGMAAGIQIWSIELEIDTTFANTVLKTDSKEIEIMLSCVAVTGRKYVNDRDILFKTTVSSHFVTSGLAYFDRVINKDFYPAIPFYGQQLHLGVYGDTPGAAVTVYCKVWYSLVTLSQNEVLAQLQNQMT